MPFLVQQNLFLMEASSSEEGICQNMERVNNLVRDLQNEAQEIFDKSVEGEKRLQTAKEKVKRYSLISLIFLFTGFILVIISIWINKK